MFRTFSFLVALVLALSAQIGCGSAAGDANGELGAGNQSECTFKISDFTNGANIQNAESEWQCVSEGRTGAFAFYDDGTGFSSIGGAFTWSQTACNSVVVESSGGTERITNINGTTSSGVLTFKDTLENGQTYNASCTLLVY